jgi:DNA-directed RNA polymerase beta subunit
MQFYSFSAPIPLEIRSNLSVEAYSFEEGWFPKPHDAQRGQIQKFGATLRGHHENKNHGRPGPVITQHQKTFIGKIPIMLRSTYCLLTGFTDRDSKELNKCRLDPGYFIINGSEKVLITQRKISNMPIVKGNVVFLISVKRKRRISWATRSIDCNSLLWVVENWTS